MLEHVYVTASAGSRPSRSAVDFFQRYPAGCNAQTGDRYTVIATVFPSERLEDELDEAAARMADLDVTSADLERERTRLLDEVGNMFERVPALAALNNAREMIRPTPRGGRRGGLPAQVRTLTLGDVRAHYQRYYKPRNAILVAAGAIETATFRDLVAKHFGGLVAGDPVPPPGDPGEAVLGGVRNVPVDLPPRASATACLAIAPPGPDSDLYAPYLILAARLMKAGAGLGGRPGGDAVYTPLLDDPNLVAISTAVGPGETPQGAGDRLGTFLDAAVDPELHTGEATEVEQMLGFLLGTIEPPDEVLALNPYGAAFALGRRAQLGIDPARLSASLQAVQRDSHRRAATEVFGGSRRTKVFIGPR